MEQALRELKMAMAHPLVPVLTAALWAIGLAATALPVGAQGIYEWESYAKRVDSARELVALGDDLFGDSLSLQDGGLSFTVTDVSLPGNHALPVAFTRSWALSNTHAQPMNQLLHDWRLVLPRISGEFVTDWLPGGDSNLRCSDTRAPIVPPQFIGVFELSSFWHGLRMELPDGAGELLVTEPGVSRPTDGRDYVWTSSDGQTHLACLAGIRNAAGEGFHAVTADGTRYTFDWMARRGLPGLFERVVDPAGAVFPYLMPVSEISLYATRVEDRHGNWVEYTYTNRAHEPVRLTRIRANDGRQLSIHYGGFGISSVSDGIRTWQYAYALNAGGFPYLNRVTRPDGSAWQIDFHALSHTPILQQDPDHIERECLIQALPRNVFAEPVGTIVHPSGARASFRVGLREHGRSNVTVACSNVTALPGTAPPGPGNDPRDDINLFPISYYSWSLLRKEISGVGVPSMVWTYDYESDTLAHLYPGTTLDFPVCLGMHCHQPACTSDACAGTARTLVLRSDGQWQRYVFGNSWQYNEGKLLRIERGASDGRVLETVEHGYDLARVDRDYPARFGRSLRINADGFQSEYHRPQWSSQIIRDEAIFRWSVKACGAQRCFDARARPTQIELIGVMGEGGAIYSRTEVLAYYDHSGTWVLGQLASTRVNGTEIQRTEFNALAQPVRRYVFGALQHLLGYHADGSVHAVTDARGHTTTLSDWFRGVPRRIGHPDGTTQSATVSNEGWLTSVTDQNGFTTSYGYDALGRLVGIAYPTGDPVAYAGTWIQYKPLDAATDWLPPGTLPGMWRRLEGRGNFIRATYYDALLRPVLDLQYDQASVGETLRSTRTAYDAAGRVAFQSMPIAGVEPSTTGTRTEYDALGRVTRVTQDSEHGPLLTTIEYLPGLRTRVTRPKGAQTTTSYLAFGVPSTDWPVVIHEPEGRITEITRDVFGKPTLIRRRNADGSIQLDRRYVYDDQQRLCKQLDPETGATVIDYDANGNVAWRVSGSPLTANPWCDRGDQPAGDVTRFSYDALNRVVREDRPGSDADLHTDYTPDGLVRRRSAGDHHWYYEYNRLRLPTRERLEHLFQGMVFPYQIDWRYDAQGHRSGMVIGSTEVDYQPNALGQPTRVGGFASGALYHPDGALRSVTLGNGITRTFTQNARGLPERIRDAGGQVVLDETVRYDAHGNPVQQLDHLGAAPGARRDLRYDALDRLTYSHVHGLHIETFQYDVLDNIRRRDFFDGVTTRTDTYNYDGFNRLQSISSLNGVQAFGHDPRGNISTRLNLGHAYNSANQLVSISSGHRFEYDGHGRRTVSWRPGGGGKMDVYDAGGVLRYTSDSRWSGAVTYLHLGRTLVAERFLRWDGTGEELRYVHTDVLGSPVLRTDRWGNVVERERFTAYGEPTDGSVREALGFTGHMEDPALGLTYMQQRYYDPAIGRFLSVDPVGPLEDPLQHFGRYHYALNNPYRFIDPDGRFGVDVFVDAAFIVYDTGQFLGASAAALVGAATGDQHLQSAGLEGIRDTGANLGASAASAAIPGLTAPVARGALKGADAAADAAQGGAAAERANNVANGIPESRLGPSGKPKVHTVDHSTRKAAREAAGHQTPPGGKVRNDAHPQDGQRPHFQAENAKGENVKPVVHHCKPNKAC